MATGPPVFSGFLPRRHLPSHWFSWGQTRPQTAGRELNSRRTLYAPGRSPFCSSPMNALMSISTGQPERHSGFLHWRQRLASAMASASV